MKITLMALIVLHVTLCSGQKIEENKFDKFDSVWRVSTSMIWLNAMKRDIGVTASYFDIQQSKYKGSVEPYITLYLYFRAKSVTSVDKGNSSAQVEFVNGKIKTYEHSGSYKILSTDDLGAIYFNVADSTDELFTEAIKTVRINTSDDRYEYTIKENRSNVVKESLLLVQQEVAKGMKQ